MGDDLVAADKLLVDKIDELSDRWSDRYPKMKTGPWQIWGRMFRVNDRFLAEAGKSLEPCDLTYKEFQTLAALVLHRDKMKPKQIAMFSMLTSGGMTNILTRLESKGLITRIKSTDDKREVIVEITKEGNDMFLWALALENRVEHSMLAALDPDERAQLITLLRKMTLQLGI